MSLMTDYNPHFVKKVYCKDCKWDKDFSAYNKFTNRYCNYIIKKIRSYHGEQQRLSTVEYLNEDNNCPYYKRKWWKVWVR